MELGLGIHNEPGREKKKMEDVDSVVKTLIQEIVAVMNKMTSLGQEQPPSAPSSSGSGGGGGGGGGVTGRVAVMINNLGGTPMLELYVAARSIHTSLESLGFIVARSYVGSFMTSLEMQGMMITVCVVDDARLSLLDAETRAPAWPRTESNLRATGRVGGTSGRTVSAPPSTSSLVLGGGENGGEAMSEEGRKMKECFKHACVCLIEAETELTEMDRIVGDGDCGQTFKRGALAIMEDLHQYPDPTTNPSG
jgi:dihydroxyacetone kinase